MVAKEPWEEKCIHRQDLVSAWVLVLIESAVVLVTFGLVASVPCNPEHASPFETGSAQVPHIWASSAPAEDGPPPGAGHHC
jgi:hypothetical protein